MSISLAQRILSLHRGNDLRAQLVRGAFGVGGLKLLSLPLTLAGSIILARGLGPNGYGQYAFVMTVITLLALPIGPGLGQLVSREVAKNQHAKDWSLLRGVMRRANQWVGVGSLLLIFCIMILTVGNAVWMVNDRWTLLFIASLMLPLMGLTAVRGSILRGLRQVFQAQLPELLVRPVFHLFSSGILLYFGILNPATGLLSQIAAITLSFLIGAWILNRYLPEPLKHVNPTYQDRVWCRAMLPFTLLAAVGTLNSQIGILALGLLGSNEDVAILRVAQSGALIVALSLTVSNLVIAPHITRATRDGNKTRLQLLSRQSARAALVVSCPIALPLIFAGQPVINFFYGVDYGATAAWPLAILALGQLINVAFGSVGMFLTMAGYERDTLVGQLVALAVNVVAAVVLIPFLGAVGAAISITIGLLTWNVILSVKFAQRLNLRPTVF